MRTPNTAKPLTVIQKVRAVLLENPDGLSVYNIGRRLHGNDNAAILRAVSTMADVYIDRYEKRASWLEAKWWAVYIAVPIPDDEIHPEKGKHEFK